MNCYIPFKITKVEIIERESIFEGKLDFKINYLDGEKNKIKVNFKYFPYSKEIEKKYNLKYNTIGNIRLCSNKKCIEFQQQNYTTINYKKENFFFDKSQKPTLEELIKLLIKIEKHSKIKQTLQQIKEVFLSESIKSRLNEHFEPFIYTFKPIFET